MILGNFLGKWSSEQKFNGALNKVIQFSSDLDPKSSNPVTSGLPKMTAAAMGGEPNQSLIFRTRLQTTTNNPRTTTTTTTTTERFTY